MPLRAQVPRNLFGRLSYYARSSLTILAGFSNWYLVLPLLLLGKPSTLRLRSGCLFKVRRLMDAWIVKEVCLDRDYERAFADLGCQVIVDIGAGIGEFAVCAAKCYPQCVIYAFEPNAESFRLLKENVSLNRVSDRVVPFNVAVASYMGEEFLSSRNSEPGNAVDSTSKLAGIQPAKSVSLEEAFALGKVEHCDLLKIDCEGCEYDVILNAGLDLLSKVKRLSIEYHEDSQRNHLQLVEHLQNAGFRVRVRPNPVHSYLGFLFADRSPGLV